MKYKSLASELVYIFPCPSFPLLFLSATCLLNEPASTSSLSSHPARFPLLPRTAHMPFPAESPFFPLRLSKQHGPCSPLTPSRSQTQGTTDKAEQRDFNGITVCGNRAFSHDHGNIGRGGETGRDWT